MKLLLFRLLALLGALLVRRQPASPPQRVLVIKPDHLGDLLLATPALAALRAALPQATIVGLVGPWAAHVWARAPELDRLLTLPFPGFERKTKDEGRKTKESGLSSFVLRLSALLQPYLLLLKYALLLRRGRYDAALLLRDDHWWGALLALLAGIPLRIGHAYPLSAPFFTSALPLDRSVHVTQQGLDVVANLQSAINPAPALRFAPTAQERAWAAGWLAEQGAAGKKLVVIHPGTGGPAKLWLPARWAAVADALAARPGTALLLTGGPGEEALVAQVAALMAQPALIMAGRASFGQLAALLGQAAVVLGVDSGPLHLAVSQGVPTVTLFGPVEVGRYGPWGDPARHQVVRAAIFCSPCHVITACPRGLAIPACMEQISAAEVIAAADAVRR
jgi:ADP-heptose:LPS heptosyltransferase